MPTTFKGISDNYGQLHPQSAQMGAVLPHYGFGHNRKRNQENGFIISLLLEILVRPESKRSRSWCQNRYFQVGLEVGVGVA